MPDNEKKKADHPAETGPMDAATARQVEQEKLTRRAALRKLGFGAGLAAFSLLGVDDFARLVGQRMQRMAGDNKVAQTVAKEFQQSGIAFAGSTINNPSGTICDSNVGDCSGCTNATIGGCCAGSSNPYQCCAKAAAADKEACCTGVAFQVAGYNNTPPIGADPTLFTITRQQCMNTTKL